MTFSRFFLGSILVLLMATTLSAAGEIPRSSAISLRSGTIDLRDRAAAKPRELGLPPGNAGHERALVKLGGPATAGEIEALRAAVREVYAYLPHDTFLVRLAAGEGGEELRSRVGAAWVGSYHPAYKLSPAVTSIEGLEGEEPRSLLLTIYPDADLGAVAEQVAALGASSPVGMGVGERFSRLRLLLTPADIARLRAPLARLADVFWIELEGRRVLLNDTTIWVGQSGLGGGQATSIFDRGLYGEGQVIGVIDTGIDPDMCYFRDPVAGLPVRNECDGGTAINAAHRKILAVDFLASGECVGGIGSNEWDTQDHGTHVAGTAAGDNLANLLTHDPGDGMAPGAKLVIQDGGFQSDNCADLPGLGCPVVDLVPIFQQAYDQGARLHTNSWGDRENFPNPNIYSAGSEDADEIMWAHKDYLLFFAAGNSGSASGSVLSPSTAKNVVSVGATGRATSAGSMASFSSCGPTFDGRIKPDLTVPGASIVSANSDNNTGSQNCNTRSLSGTSMAAPAAAGFGALARQYFTDGWYPSGAPVTADAFEPSAALVKATLINSTEDMSAAPPIPSNCQGWGRVLLDDSLAFTGEERRLWVEDDDAGFPLGAAGASRSFEFTVGTLQPLQVTLVWTDFPSTPAANPNLNNDLDLQVEGPGGIYLGNVFSAGSSTPGGLPDRLNTVEQVRLESPAAGTYTVRVEAFNVPSGLQPFALVVSGAVATGDAGLLFADGFESGDTSEWSSAMP